MALWGDVGDYVNFISFFIIYSSIRQEDFHPTWGLQLKISELFTYGRTDLTTVQYCTCTVVGWENKIKSRLDAHTKREKLFSLSSVLTVKLSVSTVQYRCTVFIDYRLIQKKQELCMIVQSIIQLTVSILCVSHVRHRNAEILSFRNHSLQPSGHHESGVRTVGRRDLVSSSNQTETTARSRVPRNC